MLDTIREYAAVRLDDAGETDVLDRRFRWYTVRETVRLAMIGMARVPAPWSARVDAIHQFEWEYANLRQVLAVPSTTATLNPDCGSARRCVRCGSSRAPSPRARAGLTSS